jgi:hypothetical protein
MNKRSLFGLGAGLGGPLGGFLNDFYGWSVQYSHKLAGYSLHIQQEICVYLPSSQQHYFR